MKSAAGSKTPSTNPAPERQTDEVAAPVKSKPAAARKPEPAKSEAKAAPVKVQGPTPAQPVKAVAARASAPGKSAPSSRPEPDDEADLPDAPAPTRPAGAAPALAEEQAPAPVAPPEPVIQAPLRPMPPPKPLGNAGKDFKAGDHVVYPTHGVGQVQGIEEIPVSGMTLKVIVITFEENRMTLKVPMAKAASSGLRKLASVKVMGEAMDTLRGRARIKRTMWSRRAQEYEQKINSGDPIAIAEVVRDLHRNAGQPDQSFSERQIYELALDRLAAEVGALDRTDKMVATQKLLDHLKTVEKEK